MNRNSRNLVRSLFVAAFVMACFAGAQAQSKRQQAAAIRYGKGTLVSRIEKGMPRERFDVWLKKLAGRKAKITWEVNDCGEQTGTPVDKGRDFPMCVEADSKLGDMAIIIIINVGTFGRGIIGPPQVRGLSLQIEGEELHGINKLNDLKKAVKKAMGGAKNI